MSYNVAMRVLTYSEIKALHEKYAPTDKVLNEVFEHCKIVTDIAMQLIEKDGLEVNKQLVEAGCLLHDIGVYGLYDEQGNLDEANYIRHGVLGEEVLKAEGFEEVFCRFASHHTGVGLSAGDIKEQNLPLPLADFLAETVEQRLVMYADKFHSKSTPPRFNSFEKYKKQISRFGPAKAEVFEKLAGEFGKPDLAVLSQKYGHQII